MEPTENREINLTCTEDQEYPICPHCGHEHRENYFDFPEGIGQCEDCEKEFKVTHTTHYTTERAVTDAKH